MRCSQYQYQVPVPAWLLFEISGSIGALVTCNGHAYGTIVPGVCTLWFVYLFGFSEGRGREAMASLGIRVKDDVERCVVFYGTLFGYRY